MLLIVLLAVSSIASAQETNPTIASAADNPIEKAFNAAKIIICLDDMPRSFWTSSNTMGSMFLNCFLLDQSNILTGKVINEMKVFDNFGANWIIKPEVFKTRLGNWANLYSRRYSFDGSVLSLGEYTIEIVATDGLTYRRSINLSEYSSNITSLDAFIYSSDYNGRVRQGYIKAIERPIITKLSVNDEKIIIDFTVNDHRVKNAGIAFYDENKMYLGSYEYFYNSFSDQIRQEVNNGEKIFIDGTINNIIINSNDIILVDNKKVNDIYQALITVYDQDNPEIMYIKEHIIRLSAKSEMVVKE